MAGSSRDIVHQLAGDGHLKFGILAEGHPDGVSQAFGHECADAHSALDASVLAKSCLGNAQVEREMHVLAIHGIDQASHGFDHDGHVRGLHRDDNIHESLINKYPEKFHHTLDHAGSSVAIAAHDAVAERAVVHTQPDGGVVLTANGDKGQQGLTDASQLGLILLIAVFQLLESARRVHKVSWVDAHALAHRCRRKGSLGIEVDIGNQRDVAVL